MYDVVALGELLIDFTPAGVSEQGNAVFERNPGGAPANVLTALARFGKKTAFIGKVGSDQFGEFLNKVLEENNIDNRGLVFSKNENTTLAFVHLDEKGDRAFSFYRKPGADMSLEEGEIDFTLIKNTKIFHFGSLSMTDEPVRSATLKALKRAKENGAVISYDPNLRPLLWKSLEQAKASMLEVMDYADILKVSEEELLFLTDIDNLEDGTKYIRDRFGVKLIFVTMGEKGCFYRYSEETGKIAGFTVNSVDTTGAGDAFVGGILNKLLDYGKNIEELKHSEIETMAKFANAVGALATTKKGAIPAMPTLEKVNRLINFIV